MADTSELLKMIDDAEKRAAESEPGAGSYIANESLKGLSTFLGLPGDIADVSRTISMPPHPALVPLSVLMGVAASKLGIKSTAPTEKAIATSKTYREAFGVDPNMQTNSAPLRYAGGVAEMLGAGGPFALYGKVARSALPVVTSSIGSGIGMEAGGDVAEGLGLNRQSGEATGALIGGVGGAAGSNAVSAGGHMIANRFMPGRQLARAEESARNLIASNIDDVSKANLDRSLAVSDEFAAAGRDFSPSLPARTASPGLLGMELFVASQNPKTLNRAVRIAEQNEKEIHEFVNVKFPRGHGSIGSIVGHIQRLQRFAMAKLDGLRRAVDDKLEDIANVFESNPNNYEAGAKLRDLFFKQKAVYRAMSGQKYQDVYDAANRVGLKENIDDVVKYTDDVLKADLNAYNQSEIPSVLRLVRDKHIKQAAEPTGRSIPPDLMDLRAGPAPANVSFDELHSLYKRVNSDLASLRGSTAQDKDFKIMLLERMKTMLTQKIAKYEGQEFGDVAVKLKEANRFYAEEYLPRFKQGFGGDISAKYPTGEFRVSSEHITGLITKANNAQAAKDFKLLFDDVPEAWQSLRNGYMDQLWRGENVIDSSGRINQKSLDRFLRKHSQTLNEFPQIRGELQQLALNNQGLLDRQAQILAQQKELAAAELYKMFQGKDPTTVMSEAMTNANVMRVLSHHASTPARGSALARAIAEHVTKQPDPADFLARNSETIKAGLSTLGEAHWKNLNTAVEALTINSRGHAPSVVQHKGFASGSVADELGSSPRALVAHYINVARGRTGPNQEAAAFLGRWFDKIRRDHQMVVMEAIFYDKDAARAIASLARQPSEKFRVEWAKQMASLGVRAESAYQE